MKTAPREHCILVHSPVSGLPQGVGEQLRVGWKKGAQPKPRSSTTKKQLPRTKGLEPQSNSSSKPCQMVESLRGQAQGLGLTSAREGRAEESQDRCAPGACSFPLVSSCPALYDKPLECLMWWHRPIITAFQEPEQEDYRV